MIELALHQPEIPPNTGNLIRLMANIGSVLHVIHPLGFELEDKKLRRAGLDYHEWSTVKQHENFEQFQQAMQGRRIIACETDTASCYSDFKFESDDVILMGSETKGLPQAILNACDASVYLPMRDNQRSLNLSNASAIVVYEAWRQLGFE
jgi:tRNA (cytidine/uridine-2'-O-)-methyltransferase